MKQLLSLILTASIILSAFPVQVFAEGAVQNSYNINISSDSWQDLAESDSLFDGFIMKQAIGDIGLFGTNAREYLNSVEQSVYDKLKAFITRIAHNGGLAETTFAPTDFEGLVYSWPTGTDVMAAFESQISLYNVWTALVHDCPYELYWFDKNREGASVGFTTNDDGVNVSITQFTVLLPVSLNWRSNPTYTTTVTSDVSKVKLAVENAVYIADKYASKDDYTKMEGFKNEIFNLVDYNDNEVIGGTEYINNSSWQMINVFDEDPATKALSDGYAKAFQYLCDISEFDNARCYTIKGTVSGEDYVWNIVTMEDGKTYLVDIAITDQELGKYGQYFFAGYDDGGRWSGFVVNDRRYSYHSNNNLFDIELLILADKDYFYQPKGTLYSGQCGDNAHWHLNENGTLTIQGWGDMWSEYTIDNAHSYLPPWHDYVKDIKNIVVKPGITSIGDYRFYLCQYAQTATIPDTVTSIGRMAFYSCMELKELTVPDSVTQLNEGSFGNCTSLEKITLSKNITSIPAWLLNSANISEIVIPDGVTDIGNNAFYGCNKLTKVTMPAGITAVGESAFNSYPSDIIEEVFFKGDEVAWNSISFGKYNDNLTNAYIHFNYDKDAVFNITAAPCQNGQVSVDKTSAQYGETVTVTATPDAHYQRVRIFVNDAEISGNTFTVRGHSVVTAEFIPIDDGVIAFGICGNDLTWTLTDDYILTISGTGKMTDYDSYSTVPWAEYAPSIKEIVIEGGVTTIGKYAFYGFASLTDVNIPESVTTIESYGFNGCSSLVKIDLPDSIVSIWSDVFANCTSLKEFTLPENTTSVSFGLFKNCSSLEKVVLPDTVESINFQAFSGCNSLKEIDFPDHSIFISKQAFSGCTSLESIDFYPEAGDYSFIDEYAFYGCTALKNANLLGVRYIAESAFARCTSLEQVIMTPGDNTDPVVNLNKIGRSAFSGCKNLKSIYIPQTVKTIEANAFAGCSSLENVCYQGTKPQWQSITVGQNNEKLYNRETFFEAGWQQMTVPVYRLYNEYTYEHFYTRSATERDNLVTAGWNYEGRAFYSPLEGGEKMYRLLNPYTGDHHYTASQVEIDNLVRVGWLYEGFCWNSGKGFSNAEAQYRLFNPYITTGTHHYTGSIQERDYLDSIGWNYEGIGWYGLARP